LPNALPLQKDLGITNLAAYSDQTPSRLPAPSEKWKRRRQETRTWNDDASPGSHDCGFCSFQVSRVEHNQRRGFGLFLLGRALGKADGNA